MNNLLIPGSFEVKTAWFPDIFFPTNKKENATGFLPRGAGSPRSLRQILEYNEEERQRLSNPFRGFLYADYEDSISGMDDPKLIFLH
jgi:hypothetical protein